MSLFNQLLVTLLPLVPKPLVRMVSRTYVAGETLEEMLGTVRRLNAEGILCTVDLLGEFVTDMRQAESAAAQYHEILLALHQENLKSGVSVKLTALGLQIDKGRCFQLIRDLVGYAASLGRFVRIDMEDSACTSDTIDIYLELRREFKNVGIVLQAYLRRTLGDARHIINTKAGDFRLCKGIYIEPREVAYQDGDLVNQNYALVLEDMISRGAYVGIATHDEKLIWEAHRLIDQYKLKEDQYEFQMLLGVDEQLRDMLLAGGHRLRVYVPFGREWYAYSMRRLKENPQIAGYVFQAFWGQLFGKRRERRTNARLASSSGQG